MPDDPIVSDRAVDRLRTLPWRSGPQALPEIRDVKGMTRPTEMALLHWLAREFYSGEGEIVDGGPLLGRSTIALASGLRDNARVPRKDRRIHSYDLFEATEAYRRLLKRDVAVGASFVDEYLDNIAAYTKYVNIYPGDLTSFSWIGKPIEILFIDVAKSVSLNTYVYTDFVPRLIPGRSVYVQQDYVHLGVPEVHIVLGFLIDHFAVIDVVVPSLLLAVESLPPRWKLDRIAANDFTPDERVGFVERLEPLVPGQEAKGSTLLVAATLAASLGMAERAAAAFGRVLDEYAQTEDRHYRKRISNARQTLLRFLPPGAVPERLPWDAA